MDNIKFYFETSKGKVIFTTKKGVIDEIQEGKTASRDIINFDIVRGEEYLDELYRGAGIYFQKEKEFASLRDPSKEIKNLLKKNHKIWIFIALDDAYYGEPEYQIYIHRE